MALMSTDERVELRKRQAHKVMPIIGPLLDAWEGLPNDVSGLPELRQVRRYIQRIEAAMENA
jgi:hypothetical protein